MAGFERNDRLWKDRPAIVDLVNCNLKKKNWFQNHLWKISLIWETPGESQGVGSYLYCELNRQLREAVAQKQAEARHPIKRKLEDERWKIIYYSSYSFFTFDLRASIWGNSCETNNRLPPNWFNWPPKGGISRGGRIDCLKLSFRYFQPIRTEYSKNSKNCENLKENS